MFTNRTTSLIRATVFAVVAIIVSLFAAHLVAIGERGAASGFVIGFLAVASVFAFAEEAGNDTQDDALGLYGGIVIGCAMTAIVIERSVPEVEPQTQPTPSYSEVHAEEPAPQPSAKRGVVR